MTHVKRVIAVTALLAIGIYIGTTVSADPTPDPSFAKFNSIIAKDPDKFAAPGQALLADGNGKTVWGAVPANAAPLPKVRVVDNSRRQVFYRGDAALAFPAVDFDVGPVNGKSGMVGADNTTLTIQEAGIYQITTHFPTEAESAFSIMLDGKMTAAGIVGSGPFSYNNSSTVIVNCAQGTKIQVRVDIFNVGPVGLVPNRGAIELVVVKLP